MNNANSSAGSFEFKAEMKQLLKLIINSLYTNPEVFLRELVSNSSDALNKVRFEKLTNQNIINPDDELKIKIEVDSKNQTFSIEDNGIGMTKEDLIEKLGTVASSGTAEFLKRYKESNKKIDAGLIGQFGVGFYSAFMVTDEITVETRSATEGSEAFVWKSNGEENFTVDKSDRKDKGTKISFKLKDDYKDIAEEYRIKSILKKYSNFVDFPLYLGKEKVNTVSALWQKKKSDIKDEELNEFYKFVSNDYQDPLGSLHLHIEGNVNFKALLFIPKFAPPNMFSEDLKSSIHLYTNNVFIQDDAKGLLPDYLKFVKGVVDTEDLPLNVSREVTQNSPLMAKIKDILTKRTLALLEEWADKDTDKYKTFYDEFSPLFKTGINSDFSNKDRIIELLRFNSNKTKDGEMTSLNGYVSRMNAEQKEIYYVSGASKEQIEKNPNIEYFIKNDIEVLYLTDPVDSFTFPYITEYDKKPLKSIEKADIDLNKNNDKSEESKDISESMIKLFKDTLGDKVEDVKESSRLIDSAATLVVGKEGMDPHMEKMMQMMDKNFQSSKKILEINLNHPLLKNISSLLIANTQNDLIKNVIEQIYGGALLIEGQLSTPNDFVKRMNDLLVKATK
jgi:molecular chaperone HtpG